MNLYERWKNIEHPLIKWGGAVVIVMVGALFTYGLVSLLPGVGGG